MAKNKEGQASEQEAPQTQQVTFTQPERGVHNYVSTQPEGYVVSINKDRKSWTVKKGDTVLSETAAKRVEAFDIASDDAYPDRPKPKAAEPKLPKNLVNARENKILTAMQEIEGPAETAALLEKTGLSQLDLMGTMANLGRKGMIELVDGGAQITEKGRVSNAAYVPGEKKERKPREPKETLSPEEREARRNAKLEEKFGPRPEGIGPRPTLVEWHEARLRNAQSSLELAEMDQRMHPFSQYPPKKIASAKERIEVIEKQLEAARNPEKATPEEAEAAADTSES